MDLPGHSFSWTDLSRNVKVGKYSSIARDCRFHYADSHLCTENPKVVFTTNWDQSFKDEPIIIGNDVWIAEGVRVLQGVTIGDGAIIGAGTVVTKDVPSYAFFAGNPGRVKRYRFTKEQIKKLLEIKWWDWSEEEIEKAKKDMMDIDTFLDLYGKP